MSASSENGVRCRAWIFGFGSWQSIRLDQTRVRRFGSGHVGDIEKEKKRLSGRLTMVAEERTCVVEWVVGGALDWQLGGRHDCGRQKRRMDVGHRASWQSSIWGGTHEA